MAQIDYKALYDKALKMLARREHSRRGLEQKLLRVGAARPLVAQVVAELESRKYLSPERFTHALIRARVLKGYGPLRIKRELQNEGMEAEVIEACFAAMDGEWPALAEKARRKKFADEPRDFAQYAKQKQFLLYRGFTEDQIREIIKLK